MQKVAIMVLMPFPERKAKVQFGIKDGKGKTITKMMESIII